MLTILNVAFWIMIGFLTLAMVIGFIGRILERFQSTITIRTFKCPHCCRIIRSIERPTRCCWCNYGYDEFKEIK